MKPTRWVPIVVVALGMACGEEVGTRGTRGGVGGGAGGGVSDPDAAPKCTSTFSGAFAGNVSGCSFGISVGNGQTDLIVEYGLDIPGTPYTWSFFEFTMNGMPATGTFTMKDAMVAFDYVHPTSGARSPFWGTGAGQGDRTYGAMSVTITTLGPATSVTGGAVYSSPHGMITVTLQNEDTSTTMPDLLQTISF
jgi:hypothetical protein